MPGNGHTEAGKHKRRCGETLGAPSHCKAGCQFGYQCPRLVNAQCGHQCSYKDKPPWRNTVFDFGAELDGVSRVGRVQFNKFVPVYGVKVPHGRVLPGKTFDAGNKHIS